MDKYTRLIYFNFVGGKIYSYFVDIKGEKKPREERGSVYHRSYYVGDFIKKMKADDCLDIGGGRNDSERYHGSLDTLRENTIANVLQFATGNIPVSAFREEHFIKWDSECVRMAKDSVVLISNIPVPEIRTTVLTSSSPWSKATCYFFLDGAIRESASGYFSMTQLRIYLEEELWTQFSDLVEKYCPEHINSAISSLEKLNTKKGEKDVSDFAKQCPATIKNIINCVLDDNGLVKSANSMKMCLKNRQIPNILYRGTPSQVVSLSGTIIVPCTTATMEKIENNFVGACTILDSGFCHIDKITEYRDNYYQEGNMPEHFNFGIIKEAI